MRLLHDDMGSVILMLHEDTGNAILVLHEPVPKPSTPEVRKLISATQAFNAIVKRRKVSFEPSK